MIILFSIITSLYIILISILYIAYQNVKPFAQESEDPKARFTIIIPFRDEANNLNDLLVSIEKIDYPHSTFEVILVDDDSKDSSVEIINSFINTHQEQRLDISIIKNKRRSNSPKKDAIQTAISKAKYEWIITTDADCTVPNSWLQSFNAFIQSKEPRLIVAPVTYKVSNTIINTFQLHDFLSLQTATVGGFGIGNPFLCNGANLCYSKSTFYELNGFIGNDDIASGDDVFLLEKAASHYPKDVCFIKTTNALVHTKPESTFKSLLNQHIRWASKTSNSENIFSKILAFMVLLMNASLVICFIFALLDLISWQFIITIFILKFCVDFLFILKSSNFYNQNWSLIYYPFNSLIYPIFVVLVSFYSMFFKYKWKDRSFKK